MNRDLRDRWVAALRSGGYEQARFTLHREDGGSYCCMGVLCVVGNNNVMDYKYCEKAVDHEHYAKLMNLNDGSFSAANPGGVHFDFLEIADYVVEANL